MRVFVQVWCEIDPTLNVRVDRATGQPRADEGDNLVRVSPLGQAGMIAATSLPNARVTAFTLGPGHEAALRHALAAGALRAIQVLNGTDNAVSLDALAQWLGGQADLVIADRMAGALAASLGWAHLAGIDDLQTRDGVLHAIRHLGRGDRETVIARLPAVVRLQTAAPRTVYIARARLATVAAATIETATLNAETDSPMIVGPLEATRPRTRSAVSAPATGSGASRLQALLKTPGAARVAQPVAPPSSAPRTQEQMADEFVRYLKHHDLLPDA